MKSLKCISFPAFVAAFFLLSACGGGDGGVDGNTPAPTAPSPSLPTYPAAADSFEGSGGDNTPATASTITIGENQNRTLWQEGDVDFIKVTLTAATDYEFSANHLCATCDIFMELYDTDGTTLLLTNDDYVGYDSAIQFTPVVSGTYYLHITTPEPLLFGYGVSSYTLSAHTYLDGDGDTYSAYYDCNDTDPTIYPLANEIIGDGISQNCSGTDQLAALTADPFELDNDAASAKPMTMTTINPWEIQLQQTAWAQHKRTIHAVGEKDFFTMTLAPMEAAEVSTYQSASTALTLSVYDSDGTTLIGSNSLVLPYYFVQNTTTANKTFYMSFEATDAISTTWYVPSLNSVGVDNDGDTFFSRDWDYVRDCNDTDATINPMAAENPDDGIDANCDGNDNI